MKITRMLAIKALLLSFMAVPTLMVPAFAQQEVDPSWYDPWTPGSKTAAQPAQVKPQPKHSRKVNSSVAEPPKVRKQAGTQAADSRPQPDSNPPQAMLAQK